MRIWEDALVFVWIPEVPDHVLNQYRGARQGEDRYRGPRARDARYEQGEETSSSKHAHKSSQVAPKGRDQTRGKQIKKHVSAPVPHDSYSVLSVSSSGKYVGIVWPDIPYFSIYKVSDWSIVDSGSARFLAWDTCRDRFALLESAIAPRMPIIPKGGSSRKAKEAAAATAQAAAAAASAASSASVQVRILLDDGTSNILMRSIGGCSEPVIGLHGGALLGVAYRTSRRINPVAATAISTIQISTLT